MSPRGESSAPSPGDGAVVVAPDKFRGTATARQVADGLAEGLRGAVPGLVVRTCPIADGGEGTLEVLYASGFERVPVTAVGPLGDRVSTALAVRGDVAVVELADVVGLVRLPGHELAPLTASTTGVGLAIGEAARLGFATVVVAVGGSSSTDAGAGLLCGLGARLLDDAGHPLPAGGGSLGRLRRFDLTDVDPCVRSVDLVFACDVGSPLLGDRGAARMFGPQKGASPDDVEVLEAALRHTAKVVLADQRVDIASDWGVGAGGGSPFLPVALLGASIQPGADLVLDLLGFDELLAEASWVVTGEGMWDRSSSEGKGPYVVLRRSHLAGRPVAMVVGQLDPAAAPVLAELAAVTVCLERVAGGAQAASAAVHDLLRSVGADLGRTVVTTREGTPAR
jgi:glycerate kinase